MARADRTIVHDAPPARHGAGGDDPPGLNQLVRPVERRAYAGLTSMVVRQGHARTLSVANSSRT